MKPNYAGITGWALLLAAILIPFVSPFGTINGRALLVFGLAAGGVVLIDRAWRIPARNAERLAVARRLRAEMSHYGLLVGDDRVIDHQPTHDHGQRRNVSEGLREHLLDGDR